MVKKKRGKGHIVEESKPVESMHLSVNYFCKEIAGLLREVGKLSTLKKEVRLLWRAVPTLMLNIYNVR